MSSLAITSSSAALAAPLGAGPTLGLGAPNPGLSTGLSAGYGLSLADLGGFEQALQRAQLKSQGSALALEPVSAPSTAVAQVFKPFDHINSEASSLAQMAEAARQAGADLSPGEVVQLTLRCQEFMFHCQLTSNIANRSSDGLQQLFRQQG
jgi:hypothetical protein